ncbi:ABC transporter ATP-binding protein [uncultured Clostridium sp.]|uniref:ABC transporter ATP-binding protein n=1 Tax=uncultured Clostridium sp. TaxID=59620 RepID=UPI0028ED58EC|nr:ABC transporter ATP-binding protein [uncultured Clostridium sp.]
MDLAVSIKELNKIFNNKKVLNDLSLDIEDNKIYGLAGRNGAGKTTLLKIIACHYIKNSGTVEVFGEDPFENEKILSKICFVSDGSNFMPNMNSKEIFDIAKIFYPNWDEDFKEELIEKFNLDVNKSYGDLSNGMKSMVSIIMGLASRAPLTMFDEPYSGLDPVGREIFYRALLEDYDIYPRCIIFSTHYLEEVSRLFESIIIVHKGKLLLCDDVDSLKEKAFYIRGKKERLEEISEKFNILNKEFHGEIGTLEIFQPLSDEDKENLEEMGFQVETMPLQKFFVSLTIKN